MWVCAPSGGEWSGGGGSAVSVRAPGVQAVPGALELGQLGLQAALCVCQALWLSPGATRHPQECGSSRLPELPRLHMEVAARKREGRGRERGGKKKKTNKPRASNPLSPNSASDKGQFIPSLSRGVKRGGPDKPGFPRPPPEPRGCARAGRGAGVCLPLCMTGGTGASLRLYPLGMHWDWGHGDRKPR